MQGKREHRVLRSGALCLLVMTLAGCAGERPPLWETMPVVAGSVLNPPASAGAPAASSGLPQGTTTTTTTSSTGASTLITPGVGLPQSTVTERQTVIEATPGVTYQEIPTQPYGSWRFDDPRRPGYYFYPAPEVRCSDVQRTCTRYSSKRGQYRLDPEATQLLYGPQGTRTRPYRRSGRYHSGRDFHGRDAYGRDAYDRGVRPTYPGQPRFYRPAPQRPSGPAFTTPQAPPLP